MEGSSFKGPLIAGLALFAMFFLLVNLVVMGFFLRQSEIASRQLFLVQKVVVSVSQNRSAELRGDSHALPDFFVKSVSGERDALALLGLLEKGGQIAGKKVPRIESSEISILLKSSVSLFEAQANNQAPISADDDLAICIRKKLQALLEALTFRVLDIKNRVFLLFGGLLLWLSLLLVSCFFGLRLFRLRENQLRLENQFLGLGEELLEGFPKAIILLDKSLTLRVVNRLAEPYFGRRQGFSSERYFGVFCQDRDFLDHLRGGFHDLSMRGSQKVFSEAQEVLLGSGEVRQHLVRMQCYKLSLAGEEYLLGVLEDLEEDPEKNLNLAESQERLKELSNNLFKAQDEERRHLADELHDGLCQSLAALKMQVFSVERNLDEIELQDECRRARQFIAQIIEDVRRLSHDLSPVILDDLGLSEALVHLVNNFTALNNLKASISVPDLDDIFVGDAARNVYRIVQEAINNVGKHAKASMLVLEAEIVEDEVLFSVKDDGIGFEIESVEKSNPGAGLGLASMAQRVHLLDGEFSLVSHPGEGCLVTFRLPKK